MKKLVLILGIVFVGMSSFAIAVDCVAAAIAAGDLAESLGSSHEEAYEVANDVYEACINGGSITITTANK